MPHPPQNPQLAHQSGQVLHAVAAGRGLRNLDGHLRAEVLAGHDDAEAAAAEAVRRGEAEVHGIDQPMLALAHDEDVEELRVRVGDLPKGHAVHEGALGDSELGRRRGLRVPWPQVEAQLRIEFGLRPEGPLAHHVAESLALVPLEGALADHRDDHQRRERDEVAALAPLFGDADGELQHGKHQDRHHLQRPEHTPTNGQRDVIHGDHAVQGQQHPGVRERHTELRRGVLDATQLRLVPIVRQHVENDQRDTNDDNHSLENLRFHDPPPLLQF
mmetsp:Transcript_69825/g.214138  ORF Transcript_69825/g.214138 Transcript_69825/m.214138 type:complete len:273 (-) Transcript_69825:292-1110(-)